MEQITVDIKVSRTLREFIICTTGSDVIYPEKSGLLWQLLKQHLKTAPSIEVIAAMKDKDPDEYIKIALRKCNHSKVWTKKMKGPGAGTFCNVTINVLYRSYLDERGQNEIAKHLRSAFKQCFHNFVQGATFVNKDIQQKEAIEQFCKVYSITFNKITFEMLRKSWQRSGQKRKINENIKYNPLNF
jgi:hypothetical protein